jgi:hypothetical protein
LPTNLFHAVKQNIGRGFGLAKLDEVKDNTFCAALTNITIKFNLIEKLKKKIVLKFCVPMRLSTGHI